MKLILVLIHHLLLLQPLLLPVATQSSLSCCSVYSSHSCTCCDFTSNNYWQLVAAQCTKWEYSSNYHSDIVVCSTMKTMQSEPCQSEPCQSEQWSQTLNFWTPWPLWQMPHTLVLLCSACTRDWVFQSLSSHSNSKVWKYQNLTLCVGHKISSCMYVGEHGCHIKFR